MSAALFKLAEQEFIADSSRFLAQYVLGSANERLASAQKALSFARAEWQAANDKYCVAYATHKCAHDALARELQHYWVDDCSEAVVKRVRQLVIHGRDRDDAYEVATGVDGKRQWLYDPRGTVCDDSTCKNDRPDGVYVNVFSKYRVCYACGWSTPMSDPPVPSLAELLLQEEAWTDTDKLQMFDLHELGPRVGDVTCSVVDCARPPSHRYRGTRLVICEQHFHEFYAKKEQ